jgi:hypothetical protein
MKDERELIRRKRGAFYEGEYENAFKENVRRGSRVNVKITNAV